MNETRLKAVVWDLDGTLIHFKIDFMRARREAIKILKNHGIEGESLSIKKSILENLRRSIEIFQKNEYSLEEIDKVKEKLNYAVSAIEREAALKATKIDGIEEIVEDLHQKGIKQAIYTYNTHKNAETSLHTVNLFRYFDVIVGRDDVENPKPHKDHLLAICKKLSIEPINIIVIGDTYRDIQGALHLGAKSIAIQAPSSNFSNKTIFQKADLIIKQNKIQTTLLPFIHSLL
jgi:HAD superfamily hydrolase (TIGR01549 family)